MSSVSEFPKTCSQGGCVEPAVARYTWPGHDEAGICAMHRPKLRAIAGAMGLPLQIIGYESTAEPRGVDESYPWESPR